MTGYFRTLSTIVEMTSFVRLVTMSLVVALAAALAAGCGGSGGSEAVTGGPISVRELAQSASTSAEATSGRFAFAMSMSVPGADEPFAFSGEGAFDTPSKRASFSVDMSSFASLLGGLVAGMAGPSPGTGPLDFEDPSGWKIDAVQDRTVSYVRFPALQEQLPAGKSWIRTDGSDVAGQGFDFAQFEQFTKNDPREMLDLLRAASGEIETVGREELRGVGTTHYRATIDPLERTGLVPADKREELESLAEQLAAQSGLGEVPVNIWLDAGGLVRKLTMAFSAAQPGTSDASEVSVTFELYDYGETITIDLPPASEVVDASAVRS